MQLTMLLVVINFNLTTTEVMIVWIVGHIKCILFMVCVDELMEILEKYEKF